MVSRGIMARSQSGHGCSSLVRMPAHSPDISLAPPPGPPNYPPNESLAWPLFSSTAHILGPPRFAERILPTPPSPPLFLPTYFYLFSCESTEPRLALVLGSCCGIQMLIQKKKTGGRIGNLGFHRNLRDLSASTSSSQISPSHHSHKDNLHTKL